MSSTQILSALVAALTFVALASGEVPRLRLNRATIALVGAAALLVLGVVTLKQAERAIDLSTIFLLLSMMVINAVLELAGFFNWVGQLIIDRASHPMTLLILVVITGGVLSALFINDPVVLMLTPLVCGVTLRLKRPPIPYLVALATASNIGSAATITGNPQNILIGTSSGIGYLPFLARIGPISLIGMLIVIVLVRWIYRRDFAPGATWSISPMTPPHVGAEPMTLTTATQIAYAPVLPKSLIIIAGMLLAFFAGVEVPVAALVAACGMLISRSIKSERVLALIDWPLLVLFLGLFIVTGSLETTGVSAMLFERVAGIAQGGVAPLTVVATVLSNTISNVPAVLLFRPLIPQFADPKQAWLTLAAASTLAGNLTLVGSVANLIVAEQAAKFGLKLSFREFLRAGVPITLLSLLVSVVWLTLN